MLTVPLSCFLANHMYTWMRANIAIPSGRNHFSVIWRAVQKKRDNKGVFALDDVEILEEECPNIGNSEFSGLQWVSEMQTKRHQVLSSAFHAFNKTNCHVLFPGTCTFQWGTCGWQNLYQTENTTDETDWIQSSGDDGLNGITPPDDHTGDSKGKVKLIFFYFLFFRKSEWCFGQLQGQDAMVCLSICQIQI